jgi:hypothetical protein
VLLHPAEAERVNGVLVSSMQVDMGEFVSDDMLRLRCRSEGRVKDASART